MSKNNVAPSGVQRSTQQLRVVRAVFEREGRPLAPSEVLALASVDAPKLGLTTVYRLIKKLQVAGTLVAVDMPNQAARYEMAGKKHHHHFLCLTCDRTFEVGGCRTDFAHLAPAGFQVQDHEVFLRGRCARCG